MKKRGQVSLFAIVGVIILALVILFLFIRNQVYLGGANLENLEKEFPQIQEHVQGCLKEAGDKYIPLIGKQGGYLSANPGTFRQYGGVNINYLCYNIEGKPECRNRGLRLSDIKTSLEKAMAVDVNKCTNVEQFKKIGLDVSKGEVSLNVDIGEDKVLIEAKLPIKISKGDVEAKRDTFSTELDYPLGRLYNSVKDIVDSEALYGNIDTLTYSVLKTRVTNKPYIVQKLQPYPDKLFILKIKDNPSKNNEFIFQFFVQDEPL